MGLGFLLALVAMATIREVLGAGSFAGFEIPFFFVRDAAGEIVESFTLPILTQAPGGFLVFGILIAIINKIGPKAGEKKRRSFSCEGCPSASVCGKVSCSEVTELVLDTENKEEGEA